MSNENATPSSNEQVVAVSPETPTTPATPSTPEASLLGQQQSEAQTTPEAPTFEPIAPTDFKFPEGFDAEEPLVNEFVELLNKQDISPKDRAQGLIDLQAKVAEASVEKLRAAWNEEQENLVKQVRNDPEIGGVKLEPILGRISQVLDQYPKGGEIRALMDKTGMGNHPEAIKFMKWVADQLTEGQPAVGAPAANAKPSAEALLYPSMTKA